MRRALPRLLAVAATGAFVLTALVMPSGCAGGGSAGTGGRAASGGPGHPVEPRAWTTSVCRALGPWRQQIRALNAQASQQMASATTPAQTRDNLVRLLSGAATATEEARAKVNAAGVPEVAGGDRVAGRFVTALAGVRDAYASALRTVRGLPISDPRVFYDRVASAMDALSKQYAQAGLDTGGIDSDVLRKDFDEVPECGNG
jgi:hypothetical protein